MSSGAGERGEHSELEEPAGAPRSAKPSFRLSRWLFLRLLGGVFLIAFVSLFVQLDGLIGSRGCLPATQVGEWVERESIPWQRFPSVLRGELDDGTLRAACLAGIGASALLLLGILPRLAIAAAFTLYLSFLHLGRSFFTYQWDALLLETACAAFFVAPWTLFERPGRDRPPSALALLALRFLLFKLMFLSGWVKLGDGPWDDLTALGYHWWTQPLPTAVAWYASALPEWFQRAAVGAMFAIELGAPFLIFGPRRARLAAASAFAFLMALIGLTGNYNFFNLLTLALCTTLVDDAALRRALPARLVARLGAQDESRPAARAWWRLPGSLAALALCTLSAAVVLGRVLPGIAIPAPIRGLHELARPFAISNAYGLFASMTTERFEIEIEGSADGREWKPYRFPWKPGPLERAPRFCEPHQPRLDWEMWFAALPDASGEQPIPWTAREIFPALCQRLLEGSPPVLALLAEVPFETPPRFLRATYSAYRFTTPAERRASGNWWTRGDPRPFTPVLTLENGRLALAR